MDKSACPSSSCQSCSLNEQQDPFVTLLNALLLSLSLLLSEMLAWCVLPGGGSPSNYPRQVMLRLNDSLPWPLPVLLPPLRLPPSSPLCKSPCLKELVMGVVLPSEPQLMQQPLKPPPAMMATMAMSTPSLASCLTLIFRIYLQGILMVFLCHYFVGSMRCQETHPKTRKVKVFYEALTMEKRKFWAMSPPPAVLTFGLKW
jgi:hypothetical protein